MDGKENMNRTMECAKANGRYAAVTIQKERSDKDKMNWHKLAQESKEKHQGIYCNILQAYVSVCRLVSCKHYILCHGTAQIT